MLAVYDHEEAGQTGAICAERIQVSTCAEHEILSLRGFCNAVVEGHPQAGLPRTDSLASVNLGLLKLTLKTDIQRQAEIYYLGNYAYSSQRIWLNVGNMYHRRACFSCTSGNNDRATLLHWSIFTMVKFQHPRLLTLQMKLIS